MTKGEKEFAKGLAFGVGGAVPSHLIIMGATSAVLPIVGIASLIASSYHLGKGMLRMHEEDKNRIKAIKFNEFMEKGI